ncbi:MAG: hypothetical protein ACYTEQ_19725 [Planctomycetota bacterium]|jgi:hypothetical protein
MPVNALGTLKTSRRHDRDGVAQKKAFYQHHLCRFSPRGTYLQMFCGTGNSVVAAQSGVKHIAIDNDGVAATKYRLRFPSHHVRTADCVAWARAHIEKIDDLSLVDIDASGSPRDAILEVFGRARFMLPSLVFCTYGYLGTSIRTRMNRERAFLAVEDWVLDASADRRDISVSTVGRAAPLGGRVGQNHTVYMAFAVGLPGETTRRLPRQESLL